MRVFEADMDSDLARRRFQKPVEDRDHSLLFFERAEQIPHAFARQMQIQPNQVRSAVHFHLRVPIRHQQTLVAKQSQLLQKRVVSGPLLFDPAQQFGTGLLESPAGEIRC